MGQDVERALSVLPEREDFDFDRLVLGAAAEQVIELIGGGSLLPVLVAVDFELFPDRRRMERFVAACQALDRRLQQHLVLVLSNLPWRAKKPRPGVRDAAETILSDGGISNRSTAPAAG